MKRILIPTDFSIESLTSIKRAAQNATDMLDVMLVYSYNLPYSTTDLLFFSPGNTLREASNRTFDNACTLLRQKYDSIIWNIHTMLFHGNSQASFDRFVEKWGITEAYVPGNYSLKLTKNSFDPTALIEKSKLVVHEIFWEYPLDASEIERWKIKLQNNE